MKNQIENDKNLKIYGWIYAKKNNLLLVTQDQKPTELADIVGVKNVLISNALIAKIADAKIREKYPNLT